MVNDTDLAPSEYEMELLDHLGMPKSVEALYRQRFSVDLINRDDDRDYEEAARIFEWAMAFFQEHGQAPDKTAFADKFPEYEFDTPKWPIDHLIQRFRERYRRNEIRTAMHMVGQIAANDPAEAVRIAISEFTHIAQTTADRRGRIEIADWEYHLDAHLNKEEIRGYTFGWPQVDDVLGGIKPGCLYFVIGRPKRYKSWFLLKSAVEAAKAGRRVAFHSLEMGQEEMFHRAMCMFSGVPWNAFRDNILEPEQIQMMKMELNVYADRGFSILRPPVGERSVPGLLSAAKEVEADFVVIDQLKFIESPRANSNDARWQKVEYVSEDLKEASQTLPFYVACQFNREAANLAEMADLSKIGLSDSIGQTADMLLGLHQTKEMRDSKQIQFGTIESRSYEHALFEIDTVLMGRMKNGSEYGYLEPIKRAE